MSALAAIVIMAQSVTVASVQAAPYNLTDCKTVFIPMNYDQQQRPVDKRAQGKSRPMQKQKPTLRPCLTRASG